MMMNRTALYIRLSKEDFNNNGNNSESVNNQKILLTKYVNDNHYNLFNIYIDDGYTGTNFDRPSFKQMIKDIEKNLIDIVIVKDLSRLGRDYIKTGEYVEKWFPLHNVRFISILDGIDSLYELSSNEMAPFKSVINDMYSRDNSKKIKAALRTKQEEGLWVGGCPPFGYMTTSNNKNQLIINEEEAIIVKKIFKLAFNGNSLNKIADILTNDKVPTPSMFRNKKSKYSSSGLWSPVSIKSILTNELYTGNMLQNRRKKINYKIKKIVKNDRSSWIIVNNTHEPIIDAKTFQYVNKILSTNRRLYSSNQRELLEGLVYCYDCKKKLVLQRGKYKYFVCNTYRKYSKLGLCSCHSISYNNLEKEIKTIINRTIIHNMNLDREKLRSLYIKLIDKIYIHKNKEVDVYFNFKNTSLSP